MSLNAEEPTFQANTEVVASETAPVAVETGKGFGTKKVVEATEEVEDSAGDRTYASQAKRGVPEYNVFIRTEGGGDEEWVPVGSMTIPRDTLPSKAIFEVED